MNLSPGELFEHKYRIEQPLKSDGWSTLYRVRLEAGGYDAALRVLPMGDGTDFVARERLRNDVRLAMGLSHPNIAAVYEYGESAPGSWVASEWLLGRSLDALVAERGAAPASFVAELLTQLLTALSEAHAVGLLHRDVRPGNVFVPGFETVDGLKLTDFGIARALRPDELPARHRPSGMPVIGAPGYLAPELLAGEMAGPHSDLYSAGLVALEMLIGRPVYPGDSMRARAEAQLGGPPTLPPQLTGIPLVSQVIVHLIAPDPASRYVSADQALGDLFAITQGGYEGAAGLEEDTAPSVMERSGASPQTQPSMPAVERPEIPQTRANPSIPVAAPAPAASGRASSAVIGPPPNRLAGARLAMLIVAVVFLLGVIGFVVWSVVSDADDGDATASADEGAPVEPVDTDGDGQTARVDRAGGGAASAATTADDDRGDEPAAPDDDDAVAGPTDPAVDDHDDDDDDGSPDVGQAPATSTGVAGLLGAVGTPGTAAADPADTGAAMPAAVAPDAGAAGTNPTPPPSGEPPPPPLVTLEPVSAGDPLYSQCERDGRLARCFSFVLEGGREVLLDETSLGLTGSALSLSERSHPFEIDVVDGKIRLRVPEHYLFARFELRGSDDTRYTVLAHTDRALTRKSMALYDRTVRDHMIETLGKDGAALAPPIVPFFGERAELGAGDSLPEVVVQGAEEPHHKSETRRRVSVITASDGRSVIDVRPAAYPMLTVRRVRTSDGPVVAALSIEQLGCEQEGVVAMWRLDADKQPVWQLDTRRVGEIAGLPDEVRTAGTALRAVLVIEEDVVERIELYPSTAACEARSDAAVLTW